MRGLIEDPADRIDLSVLIPNRQNDLTARADGFLNQILLVGLVLLGIQGQRIANHLQNGGFAAAADSDQCIQSVREIQPDTAQFSTDEFCRQNAAMDDFGSLGQNAVFMILKGVLH